MSTVYVYTDDSGSASVFDDKALAEGALAKAKELGFMWHKKQLEEVELNQPNYCECFMFSLDENWNIVDRKEVINYGKEIYRVFDLDNQANVIYVSAYSEEELWEFLTPERKGAFMELQEFRREKLRREAASEERELELLRATGKS